MMKSHLPIALGVMTAIVTAQQPDQPVIRPDATPTRLAVADFVPRTSANKVTSDALKVFNQVLWDDLVFSAYFKMPSKSFYPLRPLRGPRDVGFDEWQAPQVDADFLAFGNLQVDAGGVVLEAYLYDVGTREQVLGKRFTVPDSERVRSLAHAFADQVVFRLTAGQSQGVARTRIAYSSKRGQGKELYVADYDGFNERTVTHNEGFNKFPAWSRDSTKLAFIVNLPASDRWELWIQDLTRGSRSVIPTPSSYVSSPAFSPDGRLIALASRGRNRSSADIYIASASGSSMRNLTNSNRSIDTSPTWSPSGRQIAFVSDRSGTPQVWVMDSDGTNLRRLVSEGGHCDSPDWSPDGRYIAYSWQAPKRWRHDIFRIETATGVARQLTHGRGSKENPQWSPDGRHIVFQSDKTGRKQIYLMSGEGDAAGLKQVTAYGINENPAWSGYPAEAGDR